jgi:sulfur carrier protein
MTVTVNGTERDVTEGASLAQLLELLGIPASTTVAELNGQIIPRADFVSTALNEGDSIELVTIVGGG